MEQNPRQSVSLAVRLGLVVGCLLLGSCAAQRSTPRPPLRTPSNAPADATAAPEKSSSVPVAEPSVADDPVTPHAPGTHPLPPAGHASDTIAEHRARAFKQFTAPLWALDWSRCPETTSPGYFDCWCRHACAVRLEPLEGMGDLPEGATLLVRWPYAEVDGPEVLIGPGGRILECAYSGLGVPRRSMTCPARPIGR